MKASTIKSEERKKSIWDYLSRHFGKSFWIMTILSVSCSAKMAASSALSVTDNRAEASIVFSPDEIDFGVLPFGTPSDAQIVMIGNAGTVPLLIENLSVSNGFSIAANSCPQPPNTVASQGSCLVDVVFMSSFPENWVGYLQVNYGSGRAITIQLKGSAHSGMEMLASMLP